MRNGGTKKDYINQEKMTTQQSRQSNKRGHKQLSPKWIPKDLWDYVKNTAKKKDLTETTIVIESLELHRKQEAE